MGGGTNQNSSNDMDWDGGPETVNKSSDFWWLKGIGVQERSRKMPYFA